MNVLFTYQLIKIHKSSKKSTYFILDSICLKLSISLQDFKHIKCYRNIINTPLNFFYKFNNTVLDAIS